MPKSTMEIGNLLQKAIGNKHRHESKFKLSKPD